MCLLVMMVGAGCVSTPERRAVKTGESLRALRPEVVAARQQVADTLALLAPLAVAPQGNVRPWYEHLARNLEAIETQAGRDSKRTEAYQERAQAYVRAWGLALPAIKDREMRQLSARHRAEVIENLTAIEKKATATRAGYEPLLRDLRGIRQHLGRDLTTGGVLKIQPMILNARTDGAALQKCFEEYLAEIDRLAELLDRASPSGPSAGS